MAKVVNLHGARPGGWAKDRWAWIGAVMADGELTPLARLVACSLAQGFANHETAECRPGLAALMAAVAAPKRTVLRALNDLQLRGWIERRGGNAPGKLATYAFMRPVQVSKMAPERVPPVTPEQVPDLAQTGAIFGAPPCTPHKDKPQLNHNQAPHPRAAIRGLPKPQVATSAVAYGSDREAAWNRWLQERGYPPLERIGRRISGGWEMPVGWPPQAGEDIPEGIARRFADWLRSKA